LIEAVAMHDSTGAHESFSWQTHVPPDFANRTYLELFKHYSCRNESRNEGPPALAIALYRQASDTDNFYVLTCPPKSMVLKNSDYVIWLGPMSFGHEMTRNQLLRNASKQANAPMPTLDHAGQNGASQSSDPSGRQSTHAVTKADDVNLQVPNVMNPEDLRLQTLEQLLKDMNQKLERLSNQQAQRNPESAGNCGLPAAVNAVGDDVGRDRSRSANGQSNERRPSRQSRDRSRDAFTNVTEMVPSSGGGPSSQGMGRMEPALCLNRLIPCATPPEKHANAPGNEQNQGREMPYSVFGNCSSVCRETCGKDSINAGN